MKTAKAFVVDELEHHYDELLDKRERLSLMGVIAAPNVSFDTPDTEGDFFD